jgi:imidazolonepropionase-like amidohydrolase
MIRRADDSRAPRARRTGINRIALAMTPLLALLASSASSIVFAQAQPQPQPRAAATWAIVGVTLIDGTGAPPRNASRIVGQGDRIVCAGGAAECTVPDGAVVLDAAGKWAIPGLIDAHVHLEWDVPGEARRAQTVRLALGITTTRDAGTRGQLERTLAARGPSLAPETPEPRLVVSGLVADGDMPEGMPEGMDVAARVRQLAGLGVDAVKIKRRFSAAQLQDIAREAHLAGLPVWGHTWDEHGSFLTPSLDAGIDGVAHMFTLSEFAVRADPARPPAPQGLAFWVWLVEAWNHQDEIRLRGALDRMVAQNVWLEPLLAAERHFTLPYPVPADVAYLDEVPSLEQLIRGWLPIGDSGWQRRRDRRERIDAVYARMCRTVRSFHERGGMVITGSDESPAGLALLDEVSLLADCGFTPAQAIQSATQHAATALRLRDVGTIAPGQRADIVLLGADPIADLANLRSTWRVVKAGHVYDPAALLEPFVSAHARAVRTAWIVRAAVTGVLVGLVALVVRAVAAYSLRRRRP